MAKQRIVKRKPSLEMDRRFTNIASQLQTIEDQIENKFRVMEDQVESKLQAAIENNTNHFDRIHSDLEQIKKINTKSKRGSSFSRKRNAKKGDVHSVETNDGTGEDVGSHLVGLLQNPMIKSLLSQDLSQIRALLQNPRIQSLFADRNDKKNDKSSHKGKKRKKSEESS